MKNWNKILILYKSNYTQYLINIVHDLLRYKMQKNTVEFSKLWDDVCNGNQGAYATLHFHLYPGLFTYVKSILKDEDQANDLLQDMFIKLWLKKTSIGKIENVKSYFYTSIRSIALNHIRRTKLQDTKLASLIFADIQFSAEDVITERESNIRLKAVISNALNRLPPRQKEVIYLRFYESMDYNQIVDITGIKYQSVINHVHRAIQTLRDEFRYGEELSVA